MNQYICQLNLILTNPFKQLPCLNIARAACVCCAGECTTNPMSSYEETNNCDLR